MSNASRAQLLPAFLAVATAIGSLLALAGVAAWERWPPAALWHLVFAVGALPLILAAMAYFVPVLTRTGRASPGTTILPLAAMAAGIGIVGWFAQGIPALRSISPWFALAVVAGFAAWVARRWRRCMGNANPCLHWYAAALACLGLGLAAVALSPLLPDQAHALRLFHLHLNTLGFMGLTALGTLQVLLPTVMGRPDPAAMARLRRDLKWSAGGALAIASGSAWALWPLALAGTAAYAWPIVRLLAGCWRAYAGTLCADGHAAPLLLAATAGLLVTVGHGLAHGVGAIAGRGALPLFIVGFLLPLVSGAVAQLLPVWLRPGAQASWHRTTRARLAFGARARGIALLAGGPLASAGSALGVGIGIVAALWLLAAMAAATLMKRP